jgi:creatinine amidohydrolase
LPLVEWGSLSRDKVTAALSESAVVALPLGALEQHGDHLPTDTDAYLATSVVREAATRARSSILMLPCLPFGISPYHARFGGTVWLSGATFTAALRDVCLAVRAAGARTLLTINGHGGNAGALETVALELSDFTFSVIPISYWDLAPDVARNVFAADKGAIGHAGQAETSLLLARRSELVGRISARPHESVDVELARDRASVDGLGEAGVVGDPAVASAEAGAAFFDAVCTELAAVFDAVAERSAAT